MQTPLCSCNKGHSRSHSLLTCSSALCSLDRHKGEAVCLLQACLCHRALNDGGAGWHQQADKEVCRSVLALLVCAVQAEGQREGGLGGWTDALMQAAVKWVHAPPHSLAQQRAVCTNPALHPQSNHANVWMLQCSLNCPSITCKHCSSLRSTISKARASAVPPTWELSLVAQAAQQALCALGAHAAWQQEGREQQHVDGRPHRDGQAVGRKVEQRDGLGPLGEREEMGMVRAGIGWVEGYCIAWWMKSTEGASITGNYAGPGKAKTLICSSTAAQKKKTKTLAHLDVVWRVGVQNPGVKLSGHDHCGAEGSRESGMRWCRAGRDQAGWHRSACSQRLLPGLSS